MLLPAHSPIGSRQVFLARIEACYQHRLVRIDPVAIKALAIKPEAVSLAGAELPFDTNVVGENLASVWAQRAMAAAVHYLLVMTALQYRFWSLSPGGKFVRYAYDGLVGSSGLALALPQAYGDPFLKKAMLFLNFVAGYL